MNDRRSTEDLIAELQEAAAEDGVVKAVLVVGYETSNAKVPADDPNALEALNDHVRGGGEPVGILRMTQIREGRVVIESRPLAEYADEEWVEKFLATVVGDIRRDMAALEGVSVTRRPQPLIPDDIEET